jgi:beta-lactamase regulating signal transducer with metallopeptidase domain
MDYPTWVLLHTFWTLLVAIVVVALSRGLRLGPAARHALWLLVLLKLLTPPFVSWPWAIPLLPADHRETASDPYSESIAGDALTSEELPVEFFQRQIGDVPLSVPEVSAPSLHASEPVAKEKPVGIRWDRLAEIAVAVWLCGGVTVAVAQLRRLARFRSWLTYARPPSPWLIAQVEELAASLGLSPPRLAVLPGLGSPLVWAGGKARLLWPAGLEKQLSPEGCRAVLLHELAHLSRRDHWVGWLLLVGGCVWWWHPLFYWVRRQLHRQAELACDARVVAELPDARRSYAEALLDVCQRQSWTTAAAPALGATGSRRDLERRLIMIMRANVASRLSPRLLVGIVLLGLILLPTWTLGQADKGNKPAKPNRDQQLQNLEKALAEVLKDLAAERKASSSEAKTKAASGSQVQANSLPLTVAGTLAGVAVDTAKSTNRDKKLQDLEAKVKALLKEVQALRGNRSKNDKGGELVVPMLSEPDVAVRVWDAALGELVKTAGPATAKEVTLTRTTYKLPAAKAEALGKFLQQHVKASVMETKVEVESLIVTTTPEVQRGIGQFISLIEGKTAQAMPKGNWSIPQAK